MTKEQTPENTALVGQVTPVQKTYHHYKIELSENAASAGGFSTTGLMDMPSAKEWLTARLKRLQASGRPLPQSTAQQEGPDVITLATNSFQAPLGVLINNLKDRVVQVLHPKANHSFDDVELLDSLPGHSEVGVYTEQDSYLVDLTDVVQVNDQGFALVQTYTYGSRAVLVPSASAVFRFIFQHRAPLTPELIEFDSKA